MIQLLRAVVHLHDNWILHRDLKASNLLLSNKGILKNYTPIVVTLWYRAPELLLGTKEYSTPIDLWSVGCIFAELLTMKPLFPGKSEIDQINRIFKELGTPSDKIWPGPPSYSELPAVKKRTSFGAHLTDKGFNLLNRFLTFDPKRRITGDEALSMRVPPSAVDPSMFPTWPAKSEMAKRPKKKDAEHSPQAPQGGAMFAKLADEGDSGNGFRMPTSKKGSAAVIAVAPDHRGSNVTGDPDHRVQLTGAPDHRGSNSQGIQITGFQLTGDPDRRGSNSQGSRSQASNSQGSRSQDLQLTLT
ncbi:hypothetical protein OS493_006396 [Desmophyllum pertusum]|uniref:Protein kinase domain-containing protein n=1 Tax=Desmophyllum pertusum TaxID=174260 RepID=A0A9X0A4Q8_9CNID|nr:hypothetical protein OS493_006396 [Desmophyllum pertusum]